jgi:predicted transcriptional regulator
MHKIKAALRLAGLGLNQRPIALSCQIGQATVSDYLSLADQTSWGWCLTPRTGGNRLRSSWDQQSSTPVAPPASDRAT